MITGKVQNYSLKIYSVAYSGRLNDVTKQTTCHSGDTGDIKVEVVVYESGVVVYESGVVVYKDGVLVHHDGNMGR